MPTSWTVGKQHITPASMDDKDSRGLLWVWEEPVKTASYFIGCDPTQGIAGWNRTLRTKGDYKTDNAAIQVLRHYQNMDVQVAEWAAPVDPFDLADVLNALGHIYSGNNEDGQALIAIEVYPGPGWSTQRELINKFGYTNLPVWRYEDTLTPTLTRKLGWYSSRESRKMLWTKGMHQFEKGRVTINSPWLVEEMADCTPDNFLLSTTARARGGLHDDRVVSQLIAMWFSNEWSLSIEPTNDSVLTDSKMPDYQRCDMLASEVNDAWNSRFADLLDD